GLIIIELYQSKKELLAEQGFKLSYQLPEAALPQIWGDSVLLLECLERLLLVGTRNCLDGDKEVLLLANGNSEEVSLGISFGCNIDGAVLDQVKRVLVSENDMPELYSMPDYAPGMAIVSGYIKLHNGRIQITHQPGQYCNFTISLPVYQPQPSQ
ncbi:MAG: ATP-binding protein, partial [Chloroflexi bacterium]